MIRYSLKCGDGHAFDSWFRDSAAFDALAASGRVSCAVCGDRRVEKAMMAPAVGSKERAAPPQPPAPSLPAASPEAQPQVDRPVPMLSGPATPVERALAQLRKYLSEKADYVGRGFADEARRIHLGEAEERAIWGEATAEEARALSDEGVPVAALPFLSRRDH